MVKKMKRVERTVVKKCPECDQQCPVALRACNCGYSFTRTRPSRSQTKQKAAEEAAAVAAATASTSSTSSKGTSKGSTTPSPESDANLDKVGRRFRTKRMRPDYFNSMELEYASRTYRNRKPKSDEKELKRKKKRGRPKGSTGIPRRSKEDKKKDEEEAKALPELDDLYANFTPQKIQQFSFILDELNLKMASQIFKPV